MTEADARAWIDDRYGATASERLANFGDLLVAENSRQNLVSASTIDAVWTRHFLDSAQLLDHAPDQWQHWIDIGSGAGLPGLVIAILGQRPITLIEPRRLRAEFITRCCDLLDLKLVRVLQAKAENAIVDNPADVISARAVAKTDALFGMSDRFAKKATTYILPKGESAHSEVAAVRRSWHGMFHVEQSIVDPRSGIVIATGVSRR